MAGKRKGGSIVEKRDVCMPITPQPHTYMSRHARGANTANATWAAQLTPATFRRETPRNRHHADIIARWERAGANEPYVMRGGEMLKQRAAAIYKRRAVKMAEGRK